MIYLVQPACICFHRHVDLSSRYTAGFCMACLPNSSILAAVMRYDVKLARQRNSLIVTALLHDQSLPACLQTHCLSPRSKPVLAI